MTTPRKAAQQVWGMGANITAIPADSKKPLHLWDTWQEERQGIDVLNGIQWDGKKSYNGSKPQPRAETIGIISGIEGWRCLDIDPTKDDQGNKQPVPEAVVLAVLAALGLPADYPWYGRSRSGAGWHVWLRCEGALPEAIEAASQGKSRNESGVKVGVPVPDYDGQFDHLELRWERCQTVLPSPDGYDGHLPDDPPALVEVGQVAAAFLAIATPKKPEEKAQRPAQTHTNGAKPSASNGTHNDVIGAFNARYNVEDILRRNGYEERGGQWQHPRASDKGAYGINILDNGAYTHHATDPLNNGHCHDAFSAFCTLEHHGNTRQAVNAAAADLGIARQQQPSAAPTNGTHHQAASAGASAPPAALDDQAGDVPDLWTGIPQNDTGNGERFAILFGDRCRYVQRWQRWYVWTGTHWEFADEETTMQELARQVPEAMWKSIGVVPAGDPDDKNNPRLKAARWQSATGSMGKRSAMLQEARSRLYIRHDQLDQHPDKLNVLNGTIDLTTGALHPHSKDDLITHCIPIEYDPSAQCPRWLQFLNEVFAGDADLISFMRRGIGYTLTGQTREQKLFFLHGSGRNGKSTLVNVVRALLGEYVVGIPADVLMQRRNDSTAWELAELPGKRMTVLSEIEDGRRLREGTIKDLTGGDVISAQRKREHPFNFTPVHKLWLYGNHKPRISGTDDGIWRRIMLVPFNVSFRGKEDTTLETTLMSELPGILAWAVGGATDWHRGGLQVPEVVTQATDDYRKESDILAQFIDECCVQTDGKPYPTALLKEAYEGFTGVPISPQRFGQLLSSAGYEGSARVYFGGKRQRCTLGLALLAEQETEPDATPAPDPGPQQEQDKQEEFVPRDLPDTGAQYDDEGDKRDREIELNGDLKKTHMANSKSLSRLSRLSHDATNLTEEKIPDDQAAPPGAAAPPAALADPPTGGELFPPPAPDPVLRLRYEVVSAIKCGDDDSLAHLLPRLRDASEKDYLEVCAKYKLAPERQQAAEGNQQSGGAA